MRSKMRIKRKNPIGLLVCFHKSKHICTCFYWNIASEQLLTPLSSGGVVSQWSRANPSWVVELPQWPAVWLTEGCGRTGFYLQNVRNPVAMKSTRCIYWTLRSCPSVRQTLWMKIIVRLPVLHMSSEVLCETRAVQGAGERKEKVNKCMCHRWGELIFVGALSGRFLRFRQSMCSKTSGHACVCACVSPVHTERLNTWCTQLSTCLDRKVWDEHLPWGEQKANKQ